MNLIIEDSHKIHPFIDTYVSNSFYSHLYHLTKWQSIIKKTYGNNYYNLVAERQPGIISGVLPLIKVKNLFWRRDLVSIPFFDFGGLLADDPESEKALIEGAISLGRTLGVRTIELRHLYPISWLDGKAAIGAIPVIHQTHKVRMLMKLPKDPQTLMKSFKSKLRSQIKRPIKEGLTARVGGKELLDDFYQVFCLNMRDLGSPVHSKNFMENTLTAFPADARIVMVYQKQTPLACSLVVGFKDTLENPWASALREYSRLSPNMLLYWTMLEYACEKGYRFFDFGRSTPDEGTYKFKKQWGAIPQPLHWHYIALKKTPPLPESEKERFNRVIDIWKHLPLSLTKFIGPRIRKYISL